MRARANLTVIRLSPACGKATNDNNNYVCEAAHYSTSQYPEGSQTENLLLRTTRPDAGTNLILSAFGPANSERTKEQQVALALAKSIGCYGLALPTSSRVSLGVTPHPQHDQQHTENPPHNAPGDSQTTD